MPLPGRPAWLSPPRPSAAGKEMIRRKPIRRSASAAPAGRAGSPTVSTDAGGQTWTVLRLVNWTRDYLQHAAWSRPAWRPSLLLAHVLECKRLELHTRYERVPAEPQLAAFRELVRRAAGREPIAYLVGHKEFYSLDLLVGPDVLVPRPETELLAQRAIDFLKTRAAPQRYWDACTGSGAVAAAVGKAVMTATILASDISQAALAVARANVDRHGLTERTTLARADPLNLPAELAARAPFDAITANPPYVAEADFAKLPPEVRHEPALALLAGPDGLAALRPIIRQAPALLAPGGLLVVGIGFGQGAAVWEMVQAVGQYEQPALAKDSAGIERVLTALRKVT